MPSVGLGYAHAMRNTILARLVALTVVLAAPLSAAQGTSDTPDSTLDVGSSLRLDSGSAPFARAGSRFWGVQAGVGTALEKDDNSTDPNLALTYHYFLVDNLEVIGELNGWYFAQDGDDAAGVNPGFTFRWHFFNKDRWTLFADAGIGLLFATDNVPDGGTSFDFMPHAGGGVNFRITDRGARAYLAARWHHVSNARINGDARNPDRDGVMIYGGVMFPF